LKTVNPSAIRRQLREFQRSHQRALFQGTLQE
jgi:hypothetical protein